MPIKQGEIYWVDFNPPRGVEQSGRRPALVIQNDRGNEHSPATVVAALSSAPLARIYPFTVVLSAGEGGLPRASFVNCSQVMTIDQGRLGDRIGQLSPERIEQVKGALRYQFDL
jgi:mRNA interferase MazF